MSSSEVDKTSKDGKEPKEPKTLCAQEQTSAALPADWSGFQTYSPLPPHGYLASSPQAHPYMWGVQQFVPPYGTPPHPYVAMYPHGGIYTHPSMAPGSYAFSPFAMPSPNGIAETSVSIPGNVEVDGKLSEGKGKLPIKRSKGSLGSLNMITGKNDEHEKTPVTTPNGVHPKSGETASEGSSEGSYENSQNDAVGKSSGRPDSAEPPQSGSAPNSSQNGGHHTSHANPAIGMVPIPAPAVGAVSGIPGPTTNLNIGMDYLGAAPSSGMPAIRGKVPTVAGGIVATGTRDNIQSQLWIQDERELKRQRRKQSNRESARRSRLRKQAECDELAQRADSLKEENASLRAELARIKNEYDQLVAKNASLKERLGEVSGAEELRHNREEQRASNNETLESR